jgi:hypothetical protein
MEKAEADKYVGKRIRLILSIGFHYSGHVSSVGETTLQIVDKFGKLVSIKLADISVCEETSR